MRTFVLYSAMLYAMHVSINDFNNMSENVFGDCELARIYMGIA